MESTTREASLLGQMIIEVNKTVSYTPIFLDHKIISGLWSNNSHAWEIYTIDL